MLLRRIEQTIRSRSLLRSGQRVLVSFSGGPDSLCLLHLLSRLRPRWGFQLGALHIDHALRAESADEARRALELASALEVPLLLHRLSSLAPGNRQESARLARRTLLEEEVRRGGWQRVALGHTALDQAETMLMRQLRGCGPAGLGGMAWRSGALVRPLLGTSRVEIEQYLLEQGLRPVRDPSNQSQDYLRNRLRQEVVPVLERENPRLLSALGRLAETCREEDRALEELAERWLGSARISPATGEPASLELDLDRLGDAPIGLLHRILRRCFAEVTGSTRRLGRSHLLLLAELARGGEGSELLDLPGLQAERRYRRLQLRRGQAAPTPGLPAVRVEGPGRIALPDGRVLDLLGSRRDEPGATALDPDRVIFPLTLRASAPGDRIRIGPSQTRKVARLLMDAKIPRRERSRVPLLLEGDRVLVVVGVRCAYGLEAQPDAPRLLIRWSQGEPVVGTGSLRRASRPQIIDGGGG